ncbi:MAG: family aminopeptidase [Ilumatobacteraceae bacterium]|nr:family aminopeptidase [Ilumatobacteraceae bacterium]
MTDAPTGAATPLDDLVSFLDSSRSPWHAVASAASRLQAAGFTQLLLHDEWSELPDAAYVISGASLIAFRRAADPASGSPVPFRIIGAHTDSPCLRVKPRPDTGSLGWRQLAVEVYGGVLLNSWLDRDLGIAGRVVSADGQVHDICIDAAICRVPQLAIHLDRDVNDRGLILDKQQHMTPVWGTGTAREGDFAEWLGERTHITPGDIAAWELCLFERARASVLGADDSLLASGRLDNQLSCWAAVDALAGGTASASHHTVIALFDHEEVGSESATGAAGPMLEHVLERITLAMGGRRSTHLAALAASSCLSTDNAHAVHPNYPERHEPGHRPIVNRGPAIKVNSNQRYATSAESARDFQAACQRADVPWQVFVSRNNMPCGTTIGPITATRLGIATVDVGVPQLSMHSARELCGVHDPVWLAAAARAWFAG